MKILLVLGEGVTESLLEILDGMWIFMNNDLQEVPNLMASCSQRVLLRAVLEAREVTLLTRSCSTERTSNPSRRLLDP
jgi:hypothetical protein